MIGPNLRLKSPEPMICSVVRCIDDLDPTSSSAVDALVDDRIGGNHFQASADSNLPICARVAPMPVASTMLMSQSPSRSEVVGCQPPCHQCAMMSR